MPLTLSGDARVSELDVRDLLGRDYDKRRKPSLIPYINSAVLITARTEACAARRGVTLSDAELAEMEKWVSAYLYTRADPIYQSQSGGAASGGYVADNDGTSVERYKAGALALDFSGCLKAILTGARAGAVWLGKPRSQQTDYRDRD